MASETSPLDIVRSTRVSSPEPGSCLNDMFVELSAKRSLQKPVAPRLPPKKKALFLHVVTAALWNHGGSSPRQLQTVAQDDTSCHPVEVPPCLHLQQHQCTVHCDYNNNLLWMTVLELLLSKQNYCGHSHRKDEIEDCHFIITCPFMANVTHSEAEPQP